MKRSLLLPCLGLGLLQSCSNPISQTSIANNHINWRSYYYPVDKLFEPKVYCYTNAAGVFNKYELIQTTLEDKDTVISYERYDSSFTPTTRERETISKLGYRTLTFSITDHGKEVPFDIKSGFVAWDQILDQEKENIKNVFSTSIIIYSDTSNPVVPTKGCK